MRIRIFSFDNASSDRVENRNKLATQVSGDIFIGGSSTCDNLYKILEPEEDMIILEDDVQIIPDRFEYFKGKCRDMVTTGYYPPIGNNEKILYDTFTWGQCYYVPKDIGIHFRNEYKKYYCSYYYLYKKNYQDVMFGKFLSENGYPFLVVPKSVIHMDFVSSLGNKRYDRNY